MRRETSSLSFSRVLFLASAASLHTARWANAIAREGYEIHILSLDSPQARLDPSITCHRLPFPPKWGYVANWPWARKLIADVRPALLHAHYATGYGILAALAGFHPTILSVWGSDVYVFPTQSSMRRRVLEFNLARADRLLSISHAMAAEISRYTDKTVDVTPWGIELAMFRPRCVDGLFESEATVIGTVKTLEENYGIRYLIQAFAILRQRLPSQMLKLLIVGGGSQETHLKRLVQELGIGADTMFTGRVPHEQVPYYQNMLDISVTLSNSESFGVSVLEACACGKPVVVSNVGGLPEVVEDGVTGLVVEPRNPERAADAIEKLIADPGLRERMGRAGRERVRRHYSWEDNVKHMIDIYRTTLGT